MRLSTTNKHHTPKYPSCHIHILNHHNCQQLKSHGHGIPQNTMPSMSPTLASPCHHTLWLHRVATSLTITTAHCYSRYSQQLQGNLNNHFVLWHEQVQSYLVLDTKPAVHTRYQNQEICWQTLVETAAEVQPGSPGKQHAAFQKVTEDC